MNEKIVIDISKILCKNANLNSICPECNNKECTLYYTFINESIAVLEYLMKDKNEL